MLKIAIASLFTKNKKFASASKIQGASGDWMDSTGWCEEDPSI